MVRLTRTGKIVLVVLLIGLAGLFYKLFFAGGEPPPPVDQNGVLISQPAPWPPGLRPAEGEQLDPQAAARWEKLASPYRTRLDYCDFFTQQWGGKYETNRSVPLDFVAIMANEDTRKVYYYRNPENGRDYYPVYPLGAGSNGLQEAVSAATGDSEGLSDCVQDPDGNPIPVVVAFPLGSAPPSGKKLVRVLGYLGWQYGYVNPDEEAAAQEAPVVNAGLVEGASMQQALAPATYQRELNWAIRRGPIIMRLARIEFAPEQTRIWVTLWNTSSNLQEGWTGVDSATIQERGSSLVQEVDQEGLKSAEELDALGATDDLLQDGEIPAYSKSAGKLSGYVTFPPVDPTKVLELNLPDPYPGNSPNDGANITITLYPRLNDKLL